MKRISWILLVVVLLLPTLSACGGDDTVEKELILEDVYQGILNVQEDSSEALVLFPEANPDMIESIYPGLSDIELSQQALYLPPVFGFACEIMLVEVTDKDDVDAVKEIFQARIDRGASDEAYPENTVPWAQRAQVQVDGRYVCMIVLPEEYVVPENVFDI